MNGGFTAGASVCPTDEATVLQAVLAKLISDLGALGFTENNCFISDVEPSPQVQDNVFCTVGIRSDSFDGELPVGAGSQGILEYGRIRVTVYTRLMLDPLEHTPAAYLDEKRGLLILKKAVLKSLAGQQIYSDAPTNSVPLLVEYSRPLDAEHQPCQETEDGFNQFSIIFDMPFYWDLT